MSDAPLIGVLALQGAFREHIAMLKKLGASTRELRQKRDLDGIDALILPGGESTAIGKLLNDLDMLEPLKQRLASGMPAFGTCAGLILLANDIEASDQPRLGGIDALVRRNAFGRQIDSFETDLEIPALGSDHFPGVFIRAPIILTTASHVEVLARIEMDGEERPIAARQGCLLGATFHPELTSDSRMHEYFLKMIN